MQNFIVQEGAFTRDVRNAINNNFSQLFGAVFFSGNRYYLNPVNGNDTNDGLSPSTAMRTLTAAYNKTVAGKNDCVVLLSDGATTDTARVDASFVWAKNATHLIGISSGVNISNRSRIAPTSGVTAFTPYFSVTANGCLFQNVAFFMGFTTGTTNQIGMQVSGGRNLFSNCHIAGLCDTNSSSATDAGSRTLKVTGTGENMFVDCVIGVDTITRTAANASLELAGATPRNQFIRCTFPMMTSAATPLFFLGTGNGCIDRFNTFTQCMFVNAVKSTSTVVTVGFSFTTASPGGMIVLDQSTIIGATDWGDANFFSNAFLNMSAPSQSAGGIGVVPT